MGSSKKEKLKKEKLRVVRDYHEQTKHQPDRSAASPGYMDWANQPNPFRTFAETEQIDLPHPGLRKTPTYDSLFSRCPASAELDAGLAGRLFYHSLALSAWKQAQGTNPWSLRINPSSGALHPTEGYLISGPIPGLLDLPGVFHYAPLMHRLERRCRLSIKQWSKLTQDLPAPCLLIGLTSIYWRESWKYGERAFRYCNHDVGHAIGAINFSARALGWETRVLEPIFDEDLNRLFGTHLQSGIEAEHADCLLAVYPKDAQSEKQTITELSPGEWRARVPDAVFIGEPNRLSPGHREWPVIDAVSIAAKIEPGNRVRPQSPAPDSYPIPRDLISERGHPAEQIIRQRRSAVDMDGSTRLERNVFYQILQRTLPAYFPFGALPWDSQVSLVIFVHRVNDLEPGLYLFTRDETHETKLRNSLKPDFEWKTPEGCPGELRLNRLLSEDERSMAKWVSCHQDIAGDGVFSLGMLAQFDGSLEMDGGDLYPRLFWECGLIGQVLYLEAEAAGIRGTGIGCFFDDEMHTILGIDDQSWQSLYHFTVGGAVEDTRLKTIPPYAHIIK